MVHPPVENPGWSKVASSSINDLPAAAVGVTPIGLPVDIETDSFPGPSTIRGSMSIHTIAGHILPVVSGSRDEGIKGPEGIQTSVPASLIDHVENLLLFKC